MGLSSSHLLSLVANDLIYVLMNKKKVLNAYIIIYTFDGKLLVLIDKFELP